MPKKKRKLTVSDFCRDAYMHNPPASVNDATGYVQIGDPTLREAESLSELTNLPVQPENIDDPDVNLKSEPR